VLPTRDPNWHFREKITHRSNSVAKHYVALVLRCGCVVHAAQWLDSSAVGIAQLVAHDMTRNGW